MPRSQLNLFGGYYESASTPLSNQNCVNWIPVIVEDGALSANAILTPHSLIQFTTAGTSANRGSLPMAGVGYFVNGNSLYSVGSTGIITIRGTVPGTGRVSMATNGLKLCIVVPGGNAYVWNGSTFAQITDPDYITSDTVVFKGGYFVFTASDGGVFFNSALNDPTNIDPLDFGTAEISPDKIVAAHVNHDELFILGEETIEIFQQPVGITGFPFQRIQGANIQKGCYAKFSTVEFDNSFLFIGGGKNEKAAVWRVENSQSARKVSTDAIDVAIQKFTSDEISNAFSDTFTIHGQFIALFTFESTVIESVTFCYNATSQKWFELRSGDSGRWRVNSIINVYGKLLCGDSEDGRIGYLDKVFTEYGNTIFRERTTQPFIIDGKSQYWPELELTVESGVGLTSGQGSDPHIFMEYSDNGGRKFTPPKKRPFGKKGEYNKRTIWRRNGRVPSHRVVRFTETDPVLCNLIRLDGEIEQGYG